MTKALMQVKGFVQQMNKSFRYYRLSSAIVLLSFFYCFVTSYATSNMWLLPYVPYFVFGSFISTLVIFGTISTVYYFFLMAIFLKPRSPIRYLISQGLQFCSDKKRFSNYIFLLLLFSFFATVFSVNKALIYQVNGFKWDITFAQSDAVILGQSPHEYFTWVFLNPLLALFLETAYQSWFWVYYFTICFVAYKLAYTKLSQIYLLSSTLTWFFGGNVIATVFSSAGPVFKEIHGITGYEDHAAKIDAAIPFIGSFALTVRTGLMDVFGELSMSSISAFPSMHVGSTMLIVLLCRKLGGKVYPASLLFFLVMFFGSFILLWHYIVDSIAGTIIALVSWKISESVYKNNSQDRQSAGAGFT